MNTDRSEGDVSESVTISLLIALIATGLIYVEFWSGSLPSLGTTALALGVIGGLAAGGFFFYTGTRSTPVDDVPAFGVLLALTVVAFVLFPDGLPTVAEFGIVVAVWTDTALRTAAKFA